MLQKHFLVLCAITQSLNVRSFLNLSPTLHRWFNESLARTQLTYSSGLVKFPFVALQRAINVFSVFNWNNQHNRDTSFRLDGKGRNLF